MIEYITPLYSYQYYYNPGKIETEQTKVKLLHELKQVGETCFETLPHYQCFKDLDSKIIVLVKDKNQKPVAFASAILFETEKYGEVLHMGLVCIHPDYRKSSIMINIYNVLSILTYESVFYGKKMWVTNCSCELSILKSVEKFYKDVTPSFKYDFKLSDFHKEIASEINNKYRDDLFISEDVHFNPDRAIFEGSVGGTGFVKNFEEEELSKDDLFYYRNLNYQRGDEFLQVGYWDLELYNRIKNTIFRRFLQQCLQSKKAI